MAGKAAPRAPQPAPLAPGITVAVLAVLVVLVVLYLASRREPPDPGLYLVHNDEGGNDDEGEPDQLEQLGG